MHLHSRCVIHALTRAGCADSTAARSRLAIAAMAAARVRPPSPDRSAGGAGAAGLPQDGAPAAPAVRSLG